MLGIAIALASQAFKDKTDMGGKPYIMHCLRVMFNFDEETEQIVAILHDLVEDTDTTITDLLNMGFSETICTAVDVLTHKEEDSYETYIRKISMNTLATKIKLADLKDNTDITRLKGLRKKDFERIEKYHRAYVYLKN